ncbi:Pyruvate/Phosphoenolpyruvate kinase-like domain-containing protein [Aspergillus aurantiobrunneus]
MIKRALDSGAHGILVPVIQSVEDAKRVAEYSKFPPAGRRGFEALLAVEKFVEQDPTNMPGVRELTGREYPDQANERLVIAVQIETKGALENVREIAAIPGIDVLFIGPFDLGVAIGHPIRGDCYDQEFVDAIQTVYEAGKGAGKAVGIYCDTGEQGRFYAQQGFQMVSVITDMVEIIRKVFQQDFEAAQGECMAS